MTRVSEVSFEFVDLLPPVLKDGVVYISIEHRTIVHNCCSGCGERVVLGIGPAEWALTYDGETISLNPSVGAGALTCNSHYWIKKNKVAWVKPLTATQTKESQLADREAAVAHYAEVDQPLPFWRIIKRWRSRSRR